MIITASNLTELNQATNAIGKYLFKKLPGAINFKKSSNTFDLWTLVLYQIPHDIIKKYNITEDKYKEVYEMIINVNITGYMDKVRVNLIEESPDEVTLGHKTFKFDPKKFKTPQQFYAHITSEVAKFLVVTLESRYKDYDFLY